MYKDQKEFVSDLRCEIDNISDMFRENASTIDHQLRVEFLRGLACTKRTLQKIMNGLDSGR